MTAGSWRSYKLQAYVIIKLYNYFEPLSLAYYRVLYQCLFKNEMFARDIIFTIRCCTNYRVVALKTRFYA